MAPCWSVPPASLAGTGRALCGSTVNRSTPPTRGSAKLVCRLRLESQTLNGWRTRGLLSHLIQVRFIDWPNLNQAQSWRHSNNEIFVFDVFVLFRCFGALGIGREWAPLDELFYQIRTRRRGHHSEPDRWRKRCCDRQRRLPVRPSHTLQKHDYQTEMTHWDTLTRFKILLMLGTAVRESVKRICVIWFYFRVILWEGLQPHFNTFLYLPYRIKVWDLSQETVVTTYNGKRTSTDCSRNRNIVIYISYFSFVKFLNEARFFCLY